MISRFALIALTSLVAISTLSACANTIRGAGADAAGAVNATQAAGRNVGGAAKY